MMAAFWEGVIAGYGIAIPVGAIAVLIVDTGLRRGFWPAFMAGAGAATGDLLFAGLAVLAGAALAAVLTPYAEGLRLASAAVLLAIGVYGLWRIQRTKLHPSINSEGIERGLSRTYAQFLGMTLLNPLTVTYFAALILGRDAGLTATATERLAFMAGAGLSSLSWQTVLAGTGAMAKRYLSTRFRLFASLVGNLIVCALGLRILAGIVL